MQAEALDRLGIVRRKPEDSQPMDSFLVGQLALLAPAGQGRLVGDRRRGLVPQLAVVRQPLVLARNLGNLLPGQPLAINADLLHPPVARLAQRL